MPEFPEPGALRAGDRLERYELLCPLAYGGMAAVWLARHRAHRLMERLVVVKTILPQFASQEHFQTMFMDEARVAALIDHPNVARTLDVGEQQGEHGELLFLVMEWVDGESLSRLQRAVEKNGAKLPAGVILRIVADACAGLHAAHELRDSSGALLNVVHRDVSPQNILVSTTGVAKLIDFGVAKAQGRASEGTSAGELKGKIRYMSPEQALGRDVDRRADIWSIGAMLYEMFARVPPFDGPNEVATLHLLTSGEPPAPLPPSVPREIAEIVARALAPDRDDRFATAAEMQHALEAAMRTLGVVTTPGEVGAFLEVHLQERARARRRSVENALAAAARREQTGDSKPPPDRTSRTMAIDGSGLPSEPPSQTSTATLGSAAVEWPPATIHLASRQRAWVLSAAVGVLLALTLIGVGAVVVRLSSSRRATAAQPPGTPASMSTTSEAAALTAAAPAPVVVTPSPATTPTVDVAQLPTGRPRSPSRPGAAGAPAPAKPTAPPPSASPSKKRDYGF